MANPIVYVGLMFVAALISGGLVRFLQRYAVGLESVGATADPAPRGGGLAILVVVLLLFMPMGLAQSDPSQIVRYSVAAAMIAFIGFFEDLRALPRPLRILAQSLAALIFVPAAPIQVIDLPFVTLYFGTVPSYLISVVWLVGLTNVYAYMDGINGLASGQAVLAGSLWAGIGMALGKPAVTLLGMLIAGGSLGFLMYNLPPQSIFLGDVGSTFLGFSLAALPMLAIGPGDPSRLYVSGGLIMSLFVFDAGLTLFRYLFTGGSMRREDRSHLYQRLVALGDSPLRVTFLYLMLSTGFGIAGLIYWWSASASALVFVGMVCLTLFAWITRRETRRAPEPPRPPLENSKPL